MGTAGVFAVAALQTVFAGTGPHGDAVPFPSEEAVVDFLKSADVVHEEVIGEGVNGSLKVTLERDGVTANGVFRTVDFKRTDLDIGERHFDEFRDTYRYECAAYELSRLLGLGRVPPAVPRTIDGREGSLQFFIPHTLDETDPGFRPADAKRWARQLWSMYFFDNLVFNIDRNNGNILVDENYELWLIDHTRAFQLVPELLDDRVVRIERAVFDRLSTLTEYELQRRLGQYLDARELQALARRCQLLLEHVAKLAAERGEALVFY